jgi:hypothetical protein
MAIFNSYVKLPEGNWNEIEKWTPSPERTTRNRPRHGLALFHRGPKHPIRQAYRETTEACPEKAQNWGTNGLTQFVISSPNH